MNAPLESPQVCAASLAMIRRLVSFNTTSRDSHLALIEWVAAYLRGHGSESHLTCGPGHIAQAHRPNEWVAIEQVARREVFLRRLIDQLGNRPA